MAPRKTSSKKSPVKRKSTTAKKTMVKSTSKILLKKHGKKLAALGLASLLGAGVAEFKYRKNLSLGGQNPTRLQVLKSMFAKKA